FRPSGSMAIGWQLLADKWYYLENSGQMTTGWQFIGSHWYYFRSSGSMRIGWISDNNKWYFMDINGRMKTGWLEMNNKWYYLTDSGRMCTDWIKLKGKWYYLRSSGAMSVGWELINSKWYYLKSNGDMAYSQWINGKYYVGEDGAMYENCWTPDGYYVGNSGVWIRAKGRVSIQAGQKLIKDPGEISVLVNKTYILAPSYVPTNLITPDVPLATSKGSNMLRKEAAEALEKLFKAGSDNGYILYARSGYRSYSTQKYIFQSNVNKRGSIEKANRTSAKAGQSEHQTGLAMDITTKKLGYKLVTSFGNSAEGKWIAKNAHKYGFIVRYPKGKESITGYVYEPWHLRYLGEGLAAEVYKSGLTYEEYLGTFP
ncbi:MAG TPA: D-alanyl-D-alanine carboxypeptidase family protein, partial [Clostridia bacterium]|nr:D-alanyl-D-alanine carboxypeptidase family protein [Clostridia bacterium]